MSQSRVLAGRYGARAVGLLVALLLTAAVPAAADQWGYQDSDTGASPDSRGHTYCWGSGFNTSLRDNAQYAMNYLDASTVMWDTYQSTCTSWTDVHFFDANLPGSMRGKAPCDNFYSPGYPSGDCNRFHVTVDPAQINVGSNDEFDTTKTMCHEVGHTAGMTHGSGGGTGGTDDCMVSGESPSTNAIYWSYSSHHTNHVSSGT